MREKMKRTIADVADFEASVSDLSKSTFRLVARQLREKGHLSQSGRGPSAAAATSFDAVLLLLTAGVTSTATAAPTFAKAFKALRLNWVRGETKEMPMPADVRSLKETDASPVVVLAHVLNAQRNMYPSQDNWRYGELESVKAFRSDEGLIVRLKFLPVNVALPGDWEGWTFYYGFQADVETSRRLWPQMLTTRAPLAKQEWVISPGCLWEIAGFLGPVDEVEAAPSATRASNSPP
jgi:hypothetical protein